MALFSGDSPPTYARTDAIVYHNHPVDAAAGMGAVDSITEIACPDRQCDTVENGSGWHAELSPHRTSRDHI
jgi:hypothetical protein